jgi:GNAT superfamily N-acetyltransferase
MRPDMTDLREYMAIARDMGVFKDIELDILQESLADWLERPRAPTIVVDIRDGRTLAGFALLCRDQGTDHSFESRALCVEPSYLGKGVGEGLVGLLETEALAEESSAILRVETSTSKERAIGPGLFLGRGYSLIGRIPDFYGPGDDYHMYAKHMLRAPAEKPAPVEGAAPAAAGEGREGP